MAGDHGGAVRQVVKQTRIRIFAGNAKSPGEIVSVFEPHRNHSQGESEQAQRVWQAGQDSGSENQIVAHFEVFAERPADSTLLLPSIQVHQQRLGRVPRLVAADAGFYSRENEKAGQALGCSGRRCRIRTPQVANGNVFSTRVGFVEGQSGGLSRRVESACSNEDTVCVVACIPVWTACDDG
jgi:hypothetical protein